MQPDFNEDGPIWRMRPSSEFSSERVAPILPQDEHELIRYMSRCHGTTDGMRGSSFITQERRPHIYPPNPLILPLTQTPITQCPAYLVLLSRSTATTSPSQQTHLSLSPHANHPRSSIVAAPHLPLVPILPISPLILPSTPPPLAPQRSPAS